MSARCKSVQVAATWYAIATQRNGEREDKVMNKADLIDAVSEKTGLGKGQSGAAVESVLDVITEALTKGDSVSLVGFGIFSVSERAGRVGRNPRTGESITIAPSRAPKFKAGKGLKDAVN